MGDIIFAVPWSGWPGLGKWLILNFKSPLSTPMSDRIIAISPVVRPLRELIRCGAASSGVLHSLENSNCEQSAKAPGMMDLIASTAYMDLLSKPAAPASPANRAK